MLFAAGQNGLIYPTELGTLYQDSAGATAATATSQPLGLTLDSRLNLALGPELFTSTLPFTTTVGPGIKCSISAPTVGSRYLIAYTSTATFTNTGQQTLYIEPSNSGFEYSSVPTTGTNQRIVRAVDTQTGLFSIGGTGPYTGQVTFSALSVREIFGNHATQSLAIDRPILQSDLGGLAEVYNGTSSSKSTPSGGGSTSGFFWCGALRLTKTGSAQTLFSSTGTNTGYRVRINASNQLELAAGNGSAFVTVAASVSLAGGERFVLTAWHDGTTLRAHVNNGTVAEASMGAVTAGTAQITIGKDNNAASSYFGGWMYYQLYRQTVPTDSEIAQLKRWIAARVGVTL